LNPQTRCSGEGERNANFYIRLKGDRNLRFGIAREEVERGAVSVYVHILGEEEGRDYIDIQYYFFYAFNGPPHSLEWVLPSAGSPPCFIFIYLDELTN